MQRAIPIFRAFLMNTSLDYLCFGSQERLASIPELSIFHHEVIELLKQGFDQFWTCEAQFAGLLNSDFLQRFIGFELDQLLNTPQYIPDLSNEYEMTILKTRDYTLALKIVVPEGNLVRPPYSSAEHNMLGLCNPTVAQIEIFEQANPFPVNILERSRTLTFKECITLNQFEYKILPASKEAYRLLSNDTTRVFLSFSSGLVERIRWDYNAVTFAPERALAADNSASRLQFAAKVLAMFGCDSSINPLKCLLQHQDHFVRWSAIQSIFTIDNELGYQLLQECANDPHPHVRNAAKRTLKQFGNLNGTYN